MKKQALFVINGKTLFRDLYLINHIFPEFYVCIDNLGDRYLALFTSEVRSEYTIIPISTNKLKRFICGEITLVEAFKTSDIIYLVEMSNNPFNDRVSIINYTDIKNDEGWFDDNKEYRIDKNFIDNADEYVEYLEKLMG